MKIPPAKIFFPPKDVANLGKKVQEILQSGWLILGQYTQSFEESFASFVGTKYAVAVNSGTSALEIALRIFNVKNKEVIVPTNTNFATPAAVLHAGGSIKFIDADSDTFSITPEVIRKAITRETAVIIIVHIGGIITPAIRKIQKLCREKGLFLLEDASHAHGSSLNGKLAGSFGDAAAFSFYPTKVITSIEGGMITTNSKRMFEKAKMFRDQGKGMYGRNLHTVLGNSWRISEVHAAVGLSQLKHIKLFIRQRTKVTMLYDNAIKNIPGVSELILPNNLLCNYYKYIALLDSGIDRDKLKQTLKADYGVSLSGEVYEIPCHRQPVFRGKFSGGLFPKANDICSRHICLPIYANMTKQESQYVIMSLHNTLKKFVNK